MYMLLVLLLDAYNLINIALILALNLLYLVILLISYSHFLQVLYNSKDESVKIREYFHFLTLTMYYLKINGFEIRIHN